NAWHDTKKPTIILTELRRTTNLNLPVYSADFRSLAIGDVRFDCDPECIEFVTKGTPNDVSHRKVHHESPNGALVSEYIECRSIFNPNIPDVEQGKSEMWFDIFPMSRPPSSALVDITQLKPMPFQLRVTIWNTVDVELNDENFVAGEKTSDIYVKAWVLDENDDGQQINVHYRSVKATLIGDLFLILIISILKKKLFVKKKDSVFPIGSWWPMIAPLNAGEIRGTTLLGGNVDAEFSLLTAEEAEKSPVGKVRERPQPLEEPKYVLYDLMKTKSDIFN
ncbi:unnamed protein product, partial [Rotaria magnacalcarata]